VAAFERIFGATIFFGTDTTTPKARVIQRSRFNFLREAQIWYNRQPDQRYWLFRCEWSRGDSNLWPVRLGEPNRIGRVLARAAILIKTQSIKLRSGSKAFPVSSSLV
jgi:hypothetical protein